MPENNKYRKEVSKLCKRSVEFSLEIATSRTE